MSDERISVAELLARGGGATPPAGGRRRRHRGGENSITVAELTGEIPVVRDDAPEPGTAAEAAEPSTTEQAAASAQQSTEASRPAESGQRAETVQSPEPAPGTDDDGDADEDAPVTSSFLAAAVEDVRSDEPIEAEVVEAEVVEAEPTAAQPVQDVRENASDAAGDGEIDADDPRLQADRNTREAHTEANYAWSKWDRDQPPVMATADFNTAQVRERQARFAEADAEDTVDVAPVSAADLDSDARDGAAATGTAALDTRAEARAARTGADRLDGAEDADTADTGDRFDGADGDEVETKRGRGQGWLALIAEVVLGLAAGAGMFYGFFKLWNWGGGTWTIALTVVLAFVVIIAIVTFTHYLRKSTDYLTLGLALLVGLVITFGPLLMALATGPGTN
ncbi:hypothetical protein GCM10027289_18550 [Tsukamurella serpentis]